MIALPCHTISEPKISMMLYKFCFIILFVPTILLAQNPNPSPELDDYILAEMDYENLPGMSTLIVKGGEIVWVESYGMADIENNVPVTDYTAFLMASVSKLFMATAFMQLEEDGLIDLDEDINIYLPFDVFNPNYPNISITSRMLMTHTSSIADDWSSMDTHYTIGDPTITLGDYMEMYFSTSGVDYDAQNNFNNDLPGTDFDYSNMAADLAGYLVEVVSEELFSEYSNTHVFDALCMDNTSWYLSDFDTLNVARPYDWQGGQFNPYAHYGFPGYTSGLLRSNVLDIANFMIAYLQNGLFNNNQLLSEASIDEMLTFQVPDIDDRQGINWYTEEIYLSGGGVVDLWGHNGGEGGSTTELYINPDNQIGIVVLSNGEGELLYVVDELYDYALSLTTSGVGNPSCEDVSIGESFINNPAIQVSPNPATNTFSIESEKGGLVTLYSILGKQILKQEVSSVAEIDVSELARGNYFIQLDNSRIKLVLQ
ncbi:MAG: serine hydrolase [Flavobacteriales bacterium]|nr:serine hydrolase [Flavobacteriales bacterium]